MWIGVAVLCGGLCCLAWSLPHAKPDAVLGRLDAGQFFLAVGLTVLFVATTALAACPHDKRRAVAFRLAAVALACAAVLVPWELAAWLLPMRDPMDNPWHLVTGHAAHASDELLIERPPHIHWTGPSRGDLAILQGDADPYEHEVTFQTDDEGFRNSVDMKQADIVFIGDSYTEAGNVPDDEIFVQRTGKSLGVTVRNLGRSSYSPPAELIVLKKFGLKCRPKTVVWQIAETNDLEESQAFKYWQETGRPRSQMGETTWSSRADAWQKRSPSYRLFTLLRHRAPWPLSGTFRAADGQLHPIRFYDKPEQKHKPLRNHGWPIMSDAISEGAALLKQEQVRLIVVLIPMKIRAMGHAVNWSEEAKAKLGRNWELPPFNTLAAQLGGLCDQLGATFIDTTPRLKELTTTGELVYLPYDTHLSPQGHAAVSELIVDAARRP